MPADRLRATHPDHVWALDYQFDVTSAGRTIKILHVVDEHTRESLADVVAFSIDADAAVEALDGSRMRDELLAINTFDSLLEAQVLVADWRKEYNTYRPHSALGMQTPAEFARKWRTNNQPQLS